MKKIWIFSLILASCGKTVETKTVEVLVPVEQPDAKAVSCQVFTDWNLTTLPTTNQVLGNLEIELDSMTLTLENDDTIPYVEFLDTDAEDISSNFALRCSFQFEATNAGSHIFTLESDDGSELFVNGVRIINNGGAHGMLVKTGSVTLPIGIHEMRVTYYQGSGPKGLNLSVQRPVITRPVEGL